MTLPSYADSLVGSFTERALPISGLLQYECIGVLLVDAEEDPHKKNTEHYWSARIPATTEGATPFEVRAVRSGILALGSEGDTEGSPGPAGMAVLVTRMGNDIVTVVYTGLTEVTKVAGPVSAGDVIGTVGSPDPDATFTIGAFYGEPRLAGTWSDTTSLSSNPYRTVFPTDYLWSRDPVHLGE